MKKIGIFVLTTLLISIFFNSCNDHWDSYYGTDNEMEELSMTLVEFLSQNAEYSDFYSLLQQAGIIDELEKDQQLTLWVASNSVIQTSGITAADTMQIKYHINHLPFIRSNLKNGIRILSLNGVYFEISEKDGLLMANTSRILESYKLKNGVIHVIDELMIPGQNMYDYLIGLGDDYSIIRDSIFQYNTWVFDKTNSIPIGVDKTGNTLYDSVFYVYNPLFASAEFNSEFQQFTVFLPNNEVIEDCFNELNNQYLKMGKELAQSDTLLAFEWLREAMFYNGKITDFSNKDITSAFGRVWRTSIQQVDVANPLELSNGLAYEITKVKIPNNIIISRVKSYVQYWQYQDVLYPTEGDLYTFKGLVSSPSIYTADATPKPTIMPNYICLSLSGNTDSDEEFSVEFPPLETYIDDAGKTKVKVMELPTGEYNLYLGFRSSGHPEVNVYFNDKFIQTIQPVYSTPWNYDRVTETEKDRDPTNGVAKWDGLGGLVGVVNIEGGDMASFKIKIEFSALSAAGAAKRFLIYHWALKPTENNY